jgi:hypothetical protein
VARGSRHGAAAADHGDDDRGHAENIRPTRANHTGLTVDDGGSPNVGQCNVTQGDA